MSLLERADVTSQGQKTAQSRQHTLSLLVERRSGEKAFSDGLTPTTTLYDDA